VLLLTIKALRSDYWSPHFSLVSKLKCQSTVVKANGKVEATERSGSFFLSAEGEEGWSSAGSWPGRICCLA
jgi:hypothetical protein